MASVAAAHRAMALVATIVLIVAACGPSPSPSPKPSDPGNSAAPSVEPSPSPSPVAQKGGTIYLLTQASWDQVDPQRVYNYQDLAFFGATLYRSLESFAYSPDPVAGTRLVPDLATDLGTASDGGRTWTFTLRDGVTFQDGSPIQCEDIKYGASRTFATDVINDGPTYAISYLDIPYEPDGQTSQYPGPYKATANQQALFDKAVVCSPDHKTITFRLNSPHGDFNYTTTLGFSPVPNPKDHPGVDSGATYGQPGHPPISSGPYRIQSYTTGQGGKMVLVRNSSWNETSDPIRAAYPDKWEVDFGIDPKVVDQRLMASSGNDATAIGYSPIQPENLPTVFGDAHTPTVRFVGRAISDFDPWTRYLWIDVTKVANLKVRQAMLVALDREAIRVNLGGDSWADFSDGVLKPNIGVDYAPTGVWDTFFGEAIPPQGDPDLAKKLLADSGQPNPTVRFGYADTPANEQTAAIVIDSLGKAGITVERWVPCPAGSYCTAFQDPGDFGMSGWGADWPNASTVIPALFMQQGGWDLSQVDDPAFEAALQVAVSTLDRAEQARKWQALDKQAVENAWVIPTFFNLSQSLAGSRVGPIYRWPPYSSWPYGVMYVTP